MKYLAVFAFALAPLAFANPVLTTVVNEFGFDDQGLGWVELHSEPGGGSLDMTGWMVATNTSICTLDYQLLQDGFLVVDSASLATGDYGRGSFRLNPAGDRILLMPDSSHPWSTDSVAFPAAPPWQSGAPMPPALGSAARLNIAGLDQLITWYVDSTPTLNADNDDYSSVTGTVTWAPSRDFDQVQVTVFGPVGSSFSVVAAPGQSYLAPGLSSGRYAVTAYGMPGNVLITYPESVDVGYSDILAGIDLDFDPPGVAETTIGGAAVLSGSSVQSLEPKVIFDAMGRRVTSPRPGVYFALEELQASSHKPQAIRKMVFSK